jgi:hypothetical protein
VVGRRFKASPTEAGNAASYALLERIIKRPQALRDRFRPHGAFRE